MVKIRLKRLGRKKRPFYRIVVTDIRNRRDGKPLAELGYYNPLTKELKLDKSTALDWVSKGAQPSDTVKRLIDNAPETGELITLEVIKKDRLSKKAKAKQQAEEEAKKAVAEAKKAEKAKAAEETEKKAEETPAEAS